MRSELNEHVPVAQPGEFGPLRIGPLAVDPPVVLAPMAGVTNAPYRSLCRQLSALGAEPVVGVDIDADMIAEGRDRGADEVELESCRTPARTRTTLARAQRAGERALEFDRPSHVAE